MLGDHCVLGVTLVWQQTVGRIILLSLISTSECDKFMSAGPKVMLKTLFKLHTARLNTSTCVTQQTHYSLVTSWHHPCPLCIVESDDGKTFRHFVLMLVFLSQILPTSSWRSIRIIVVITDFLSDYIPPPIPLCPVLLLICWQRCYGAAEHTHVCKAAVCWFAEWPWTHVPVQFKSFAEDYV